MESIVTMIGMALAFVLGAYVRQPFNIVHHKQVELPKPEPKEQEKIDEEVRQFLNIMKYNGTVQKGSKDEN